MRNFLERVGQELATAFEREEALEQEIDELRRQVADPPIVTEDRLLEALGEETARVLRSAQESAEEIRSRAEAGAASLVENAEADAARLPRRGGYGCRHDAQPRADCGRDTREEEANRYVAEVRTAADTDTAELPRRDRNRTRTAAQRGRNRRVGGGRGREGGRA